MEKFPNYKEHFQWKDEDLVSTTTLKGIPFVVYDTEIFPNYFCAVFLDNEGIKIFDSSQREALEKFIREKYQAFVGFNNHRFDNIILEHFFNYGTDGLKDRVNDVIATDWIKPTRRLFGRPTIDLYSLMLINETGGLKGQALERNAYRLQDLPYAHDAILTEEQKQHVLYYCINDVVETHLLLKRKLQDIQIRSDLAELYSLDKDKTLEVLSSKGAKVAEIVLSELYKNAEGLRYLSKTYKEDDITPIKVGSLIPNIEFKTTKFKEHYDKLKNLVVYHSTFEDLLTASVELDEAPGLIFEFGSGGLHAALPNVTYETNDEYILEDRDVTSFYPNLMLTRNIYPSHFEPSFLDEFRKIVNQRVEAKRKGDKKTAEALKLVINSTFGKLNDKWSPFYDLKAMLKVTLSGQLYLAKLCEDYILAGHTVVSANTDGILLYFKKDLAKAIHLIDMKWQNDTEMELEYAQVQKVFQKDVNNYVAVMCEGKIKAKGRYDIGSANLPNIIGKAVQNYIATAKPLIDTITECRNFEDFLHKVSIKKPFVAHWDEIPQGKVLRFYESINGLPIVKHHPDGRLIKLAGADNVRIVEIYENKIPADINYGVYEQKALEMIEGKKKKISKKSKTKNVVILEDKTINDYNDFNSIFK